MPNNAIKTITDTIIKRSASSRKIYLDRLDHAISSEVNRKSLGCSNLAHGVAPLDSEEKAELLAFKRENVAIVSSYNDMLSAHEPYKTYPPLIKRALNLKGISAQFAGGVPAMCDGITQSQPGMELSLFSRDTIAMSTAIALSHNMFDAAVYLGVCDKIVPGLFIGAMTFGHLPSIFIPAGPMPSGISNSVKAKVRQEYAKGKVDFKTLLETEAKSYHASGTCTFYGTANSNQMLMEIMGLHLPGSSFVPTNTPLRDALTQNACEQLTSLMKSSSNSSNGSNFSNFKPIGHMIDEKSFVNAIIGLLATGGSTNHTLHLIAMARAAGIILTWDDFNDLSAQIPLLCKMYPNGSADVNHFHQAGGMGVVIKELLEYDLLHEDADTVMGKGLEKYTVEPVLNDTDDTKDSKDAVLNYIPIQNGSKNTDVIASVKTPFDVHGGIKLLKGNLGRSVIKTSALKENHKAVTAPAIVFNSQEALQADFKAGRLNKDFVAVVRYQGPSANGMPELHGLMKPLGALQDEGYTVAIVTDGRMSGASGKVPSAIHLTPEASQGGMIAKIQDGDIITLDTINGTLDVQVDAEELANRQTETPDLSANNYGTGRELFGVMRNSVNGAEEGACTF
jgi:phosphogluconate dehydratase